LVGINVGSRPAAASHIGRGSKGLGGEHRQDHDAAKRNGTDAGSMIDIFMESLLGALVVFGSMITIDQRPIKRTI
jgi:hypothetical protein